jgi:Domain of unknown function (DUF2019)
MTDADLQNLETDQLVDRFAAIGVSQYRANDADDDREYKRLFYQMDDIQKELKKLVDSRNGRALNARDPKPLRAAIPYYNRTARGRRAG